MFQTVIASRSLAERIDALIAWITAEPLPKPLFVGLAAGHAATRKMSIDEAIEKLRALGRRLHRPGRAGESAAQAVGAGAAAQISAVEPALRQSRCRSPGGGEIEK